MPDYYLFVSEIVKTDTGESCVVPQYRQIVSNGGLLLEKIELFQPMKDEYFYLDVVEKDGDGFRLYRYQVAEDAINPATVLFKISDDTQKLKILIDEYGNDEYKEVTEIIDINNLLSDKVPVSGKTQAPFDMIFIVDATMGRCEVSTMDEKVIDVRYLPIHVEAPSEASVPNESTKMAMKKVDLLRESINTVREIVNEIAKVSPLVHRAKPPLNIRGHSYPSHRPAEESVGEDVRLSLILFGEYLAEEHPINNFDSGEPKFKIEGIDNILNMQITGYYGDLSIDFKTGAKKFVDRLNEIVDQVETFRVDGGDYEDCLEVALQEANNLFESEVADDDRLKFMIIITDSPPHPHVANQYPGNHFYYASNYYYIYEVEKEGANWLKEVERAETNNVFILLAYLPPIQEDIRTDKVAMDMAHNVWKRIALKGKMTDIAEKGMAFDKVVADLVQTIQKKRQEESCRETHVNGAVRYPFLERRLAVSGAKGTEKE